MLVIWRYLLSMLESTVSRGTVLLVIALLLVALLLLVVVALALLLRWVALLLVTALFPSLLLGRVLALRRVLLVALVVLVVRAGYGEYESNNVVNESRSVTTGTSQSYTTDLLAAAHNTIC